VLNVAGPFNILIRRYQNPFLGLVRDKFKVKKSLSFDGAKENLQGFFIGIRYYQEFY